MGTILKLGIISGAHRSRRFSPNPELFPSSETEPKGPRSHSRPRSRNNLPTAPMHVSRNHLAVTFPEPARPGQDPSSRRRAWERKEAPQHWEQAPGKGRDRGILWAGAARRAGPREGQRGCREGQLGGSRAGRSGRGYSLSQDSRLSPSASAILQPPGPAPRPQTSRQPARAGPGRGLHGGLRRASAATKGRARLRWLTRGELFLLDSSLWTSE